MHTPDQIGTSGSPALPRSLRAPGALRWRFGRFELDEVKACLLRDGKVVALPPTPFAVLCALVRQPGVLLTKNALLDEVWGHQFVSDSVLKTVISELRTLLEDDARQPRFIETVSRRGYRFIAAVNTSPGSSPGRRASRQSRPTGRRPSSVEKRSSRAYTALGMARAAAAARWSGSPARRVSAKRA